MITDNSEFYLRRCPYMIGFNEAWVIDKDIYVSPAVFQLLTDDKDMDTMMVVARQLTLKSASYSDLEALAEKTGQAGSRNNIYETHNSIYSVLNKKSCDVDYLL